MGKVWGSRGSAGLRARRVNLTVKGGGRRGSHPLPLSLWGGGSLQCAWAEVRRPPDNSGQFSPIQIRVYCRKRPYFGGMNAGIDVDTPRATGPFLKSQECARLIGVSVPTLDNWRRDGKIPFVRCPGRSVRFHWPSVEQALLRMQRGGGL